MIDSIIALALILVTAGLIFLFTLQRNVLRSGLRPLPAFDRLRRAIGLAVENGTRIHITLGKAGMVQSISAAGLAGLTTLERIARVSSISDRPPIATSGEGTLAILSQDTLRAAYRQINQIDLYNADRGRLSGATSFSYAAGLLPIANNENVSTHIAIGNFAPEIALLMEAADQESAFTLAATDSLSAQAALYPSTQESLIGEELFAIPAYLNAGAVYTASLQAQDVLRWGVVLILIAGAVLRLMGVV
ncbi:MAG: DUF6754 domain-containing protein [Chloroflexota bacterium]|jgi:hypothetical protein